MQETAETAGGEEEPPVHHVAAWLRKLGLPDSCADKFILNGFDDLNYMLEDVTEDTAIVTAAGIASPNLRQVLSQLEVARLVPAMVQARWLRAGNRLHQGQLVTVHPLQLPGRTYQEGGKAIINRVQADGTLDLCEIISGRRRVGFPPELVTSITDQVRPDQQRSQRQTEQIQRFEAVPSQYRTAKTAHKHQGGKAVDPLTCRSQQKRRRETKQADTTSSAQAVQEASVGSDASESCRASSGQQHSHICRKRTKLAEVAQLQATGSIGSRAVQQRTARGKPCAEGAADCSPSHGTAQVDAGEDRWKDECFICDDG